MAEMLPPYVMTFLNFAATLFVFVLGLILLALVVVFIIDVTQNRNAIQRNFPVIGRLRPFFEHLGVFFRQYFFAMDREELPFNRAQREWVYRASKNVDNTIPFGSTYDLRPQGTVIFVNCPFPKLEQDAAEPEPVTIGPYCDKPYTTDRFFHVSGMSYGALSKVAVRALSNGAKQAGIWMNTGEGGTSPYHLEGGCDLIAQIGTAKYGVRNKKGDLCDKHLKKLAAHDQVRMFELKLRQGAKPGKGGILPGEKVTSDIAKIRGIPAGQDSISPNRHVEVDCPTDLLDLIDRVRTVTGKPVGYKAVVGAYGWLEEFFTEIHERGIESAPDFITVDSADGGTGAAPHEPYGSYGSADCRKSAHGRGLGEGLRFA